LQAESYSSFGYHILRAKRFLGKNTAFDVIVGIMFGSVISRGINSDASFWGTLLASITLIGLHWLTSYLSYNSDWLGAYVKGSKRILVENGQIDWDAMQSSSISRKDLMRAIRSNGSTEDLAQVKQAILERNGEISVLTKDAPHTPPRVRILEVEVQDGVQRIRIEIS
jgi:uncharacterized membrane protein YcaP (DUF421 family)